MALIESTRRLWLPIGHGVLCAINFITNNPRLNLDGLKAFASFLGMILMVNLIAQVTECMYCFPQPFAWLLLPEGLRSIFLWFEIEWCVFVGTLFSNVLFIALRTQIRHKIQLDRVPEKKQLPGIDTIVAIQEVANAFGAQIIPLVVGMYIYIQKNNTNNGVLFWELKMILFSNLISALCITYLIFVPWKKGPEWYLKHSHKVFFVLLVTNYLVLPIINNIAFIYFITDPQVDLKKESIESYIVFFNIVCFMRIVEYVVIVRRTVWLDAKVYL